MNEEKYRRLAENINDALFELDNQGYFVFVSPVIEKMTRYSCSEILGQHFTQLVHPDDMLLIQFSFEQVLGGSIEAHEFRVKNKDGQWRYMRASGHARWIDGKPAGISGVLTDITERKLAEEALKKSEEYFRALTENSTDIIMVLSVDGQIRFISGAFERITGHSLDSEVSKNFLAYIYPEDSLEATQLFAAASSNPGYSGQLELRLLHKDGSVRYVEIICKNALDNPAVRGIIVNVHDISARRQIEERQKQLEEELHLSSRLASIGQLAAGVGHEINNPLTSIIGFAQLLERQNLPDDAKEKIKVISSEAKRVARIVEGLITLARKEALQKNQVDINGLLEQILKLRAYELNSRNIQVVRDYGANLPLISGDGAQLQQVFLNLILNAEKEMSAAHGRGRLTIKTEPISGGVGVSVSDDGPGISPENMGKIFTPFFTTRSVGDGMGLGLSICHGIVTRHGGKIFARSQVGKGASFVVELPSVSGPMLTEPERTANKGDFKALFPSS